MRYSALTLTKKHLPALKLTKTGKSEAVKNNFAAVNSFNI